MFSFLRKNKKKDKTSRVGHILILEETMPIFHGVPAITNKRYAIVTKDAEGDIVRGLVNYSGEKDILYKKDRILTQEGVPIKAKKEELDEIIANNDFIKNNFKKGQVYMFSRMGYLEDLQSDEIVICVTDTMVIFKSIGSNNLSMYSYSELEEMFKLDKLRVVFK